MKLIHTLALALLLFAGLNCGTENPVEETIDTAAVETLTGTLRGEVQSIDGALIQVRLLRDGQLLTQIEAASDLRTSINPSWELHASNIRERI